MQVKDYYEIILKLLELDRSTWNHTAVCKLLTIDMTDPFQKSPGVGCYHIHHRSFHRWPVGAALNRSPESLLVSGDFFITNNCVQIICVKNTWIRIVSRNYLIPHKKMVKFWIQLNKGRHAVKPNIKSSYKEINAPKENLDKDKINKVE